MKLALAQFRIKGGAIRRNVDRAVDAIETAAARDADLVVLPEMFTVGYFAFEDYPTAAESLDGRTLSRLGAVADEQHIAVLAGSIVEDLHKSRSAGVETPAPEGYANTAVFFDRTGDRRGVYRKHHLFGYESAEQELLTAGEHLTTVEFDGFTVGTTTCYDLRFPSLYQRLVDRGVTLTLVPSAWPYPRVEHWRLFPRVRAVENLMYVAAVNGLGTFESAELLGRSAVYGPWGTKLAGAGDEQTVLTAHLDPGRVATVRESFPALADRR